MQIYHKFYDNKVDTSDEELEDGSYLIDKTNYTVTNTKDLSTKNIFRIKASKQFFYLFNDQFDYALAHYFAELGINKRKANKFLSDPLMISLSEKWFYQNADK